MIAGSHASTMCVNNDSTSIVLDPTIDGTNYTYSAADFTWSANFPYGTVSGIAACLSSNHGKGYSQSATNLTDENPDTGVTSPVVGGERNGLHCFCRMLHPAASLWVFIYSSGSADDCFALCASSCGGHVRSRADFRAGVFGSVRN